MSKAHAILAPSGASRWLVCTPSARFEEQIPEADTPYSVEGTIAHDLAALVLSVRAGVYKGDQKRFSTDIRAIEQTAAAFYEKQGWPNGFNAMYDHAEDYAAYIREQIPMTGQYKLLIEQRVDMSKYAPVCYGTTDAAVITPKVLFVDDYKYGAGVRVSATGNKQMMLYALGALLKAWELDLDPDRVVMSIIQPRVSDTPSTWEIDTDDLLDWAEKELAPKAKLAIGGQGDFVAGKHCHFCKAKSSCKAYFDHFEDLRDIMDKRIMTEGDLRTVLTYGNMVSSWVKKVETDAKARLQNGGRIKGFKLVAGTPRRAFINQDDVVDMMIGQGYDTDEIFKMELRGITDLESVFGKKKFAALFGENITLQEGNPQLVTEDDDRPAIDRTAADDYDDEDDLL